MNFQRQGAVMKNSILVVLMTIASSVSANAQEQEQEQGYLNVSTVVQKEEAVVSDAGEAETRLVPADIVVPGDRVVYTITFRNIGDEPTGDVVVTNPIAENLTFAEGSAFGPGTVIRFSVDGGATFADRAALTVTQNGESRAATAEDLTHIRWTLQTELAVGAQGIARFAAVVD
jgi:uncharacterized repeat protein (TIGR01451 family)